MALYKIMPIINAVVHMINCNPHNCTYIFEVFAQEIPIHNSLHFIYAWLAVKNLPSVGIDFLLLRLLSFTSLTLQGLTIFFHSASRSSKDGGDGVGIDLETDDPLEKES